MWVARVRFLFFSPYDLTLNILSNQKQLAVFHPIQGDPEMLKWFFRGPTRNVGSGA